MSDNVNIVSLITAALAAKDAEIVRLRGDHIENDEQSLCGCHSCEHYELVNAKAEIARLREVIDAYENPTDEWCYEENCRYRHWRSGNMPTHMRGRECPTAKVTATTEEGK